MVRRWAGDSRIRAAAYAFAVLLFGTGIALAWSRAEVAANAIDLRVALAVVLLGVPLQVLFGGLLLQVLARPSGTPVPLARACRIVGLGTLSGVLPAASGNIVRGAALHHWGLSTPAVLRTMAVDVVTWVAVALIISGAALISASATWYGSAALVLGLLIGLPVIIAAVSAWGSGGALRRVGWRLGGILVDVTRLWACFGALTHFVSLGAVAALAAAAPISSLLFFLPGGLGVQELVTAGLARAAMLDPSVAFLAASLNRLLGLFTLGTFELIVAAGAAKGLARSSASAMEESTTKETYRRR